MYFICVCVFLSINYVNLLLLLLSRNFIFTFNRLNFFLKPLLFLFLKFFFKFRIDFSNCSFVIFFKQYFFRHEGMF